MILQKLFRESLLSWRSSERNLRRLFNLSWCLYIIYQGRHLKCREGTPWAVHPGELYWSSSFVGRGVGGIVIKSGGFCPGEVEEDPGWRGTRGEYEQSQPCLERWLFVTTTQLCVGRFLWHASMSNCSLVADTELLSPSTIPGRKVCISMAAD